ncbi:hypothetical protein UP10_41965 [Bradyrhizobium sp. LTSPM299]|nr:hypothetical protein UP10_41965 [Bradyrhizobium sp. LTSPM299]
MPQTEKVFIEYPKQENQRSRHAEYNGATTSPWWTRTVSNVRWKKIYAIVRFAQMKSLVKLDVGEKD